MGLLERLTRGFRTAYGLREEKGWAGTFTRNEAPGALPNGTRVCKVNSKPGDANPDGTLGVVLGSFPIEDPESPARHFYFIEWTGMPHVACGITDFRIAVYREPEPDTEPTNGTA